MKAAILVILSALLNIQSGGCTSDPRSCSHPPFKWCSSLATAVECGVRTATYSNIYPVICNFTFKKSTRF